MNRWALSHTLDGHAISPRHWSIEPVRSTRARDAIPEHANATLKAHAGRKWHLDNRVSGLKGLYCGLTLSRRGIIMFEVSKQVVNRQFASRHRSVIVFFYGNALGRQCDGYQRIRKRSEWYERQRTACLEGRIHDIPWNLLLPKFQLWFLIDSFEWSIVKTLNGTCGEISGLCFSFFCILRHYVVETKNKLGSIWYISTTEPVVAKPQVLVGLTFTRVVRFWSSL